MLLKSRLLLTVLISHFIGGYHMIEAKAENERPSPPPGGSASGIYCHQILAADSDNGESFKPDGQVLLDHASVPDIILFGGQPLIYYVNGDPESDHGIYTASRDANLNWARGNKVLLDGVFEGDAVDPDVVPTEGTIQLFYYLGHFITPVPARQEPHPIYRAESTDGVHFKVLGKVFEAPEITDPTVIRFKDGSWLMATASKGRIIIAESSDGMKFNPLTEINTPGIPELALIMGDQARLYLNSPQGIGSYLSTDHGKSWDREQGVRLNARSVADPSVIRQADGSWVMVYKKINSQCVPPQRQTTLLPGSQPHDPRWQAFRSPDEELLNCFRRHLDGPMLRLFSQGFPPREEWLIEKGEQTLDTCLKQ